MGQDFGTTLQQVSAALGAFNNAIRQATSPPGTYPPGYPYATPPYATPYGAPAAPAYPMPGPMPGDRVQWTAAAAPAQPVQPVQSAPSGFMGVLSAIWNGVVDFFKRLRPAPSPV